MSVDALPCVACGKPLKNVDETATNQPLVGLAFATRGHYGSTVWDGEGDELLEISVCDTCLLRAGDAGRVLRHSVTEPPSSRYLAPVPWKEDDPEAIHRTRLENEMLYGSRWGEDEMYAPAYENEA